MNEKLVRFYGTPSSRLLEAECVRLQKKYGIEYGKAVDVLYQESPGLIKYWADSISNPSSDTNANHDFEGNDIDEAEFVKVDRRVISLMEELGISNYNDGYTKLIEDKPELLELYQEKFYEST